MGVLMVTHVNGSCTNGYKMTYLEFNRLLQHELGEQSEELTWCEDCELASKVEVEWQIVKVAVVVVWLATVRLRLRMSTLQLDTRVLPFQGQSRVPTSVSYSHRRHNCHHHHHRHHHEQVSCEKLWSKTYCKWPRDPLHPYQYRHCRCKREASPVKQKTNSNISSSAHCKYGK